MASQKPNQNSTSLDKAAIAAAKKVLTMKNTKNKNSASTINSVLNYELFKERKREAEIAKTVPQPVLAGNNNREASTSSDNERAWITPSRKRQTRSPTQHESSKKTKAELSNKYALLAQDTSNQMEYEDENDDEEINSQTQDENQQDAPPASQQHAKSRPPPIYTYEKPLKELSIILGNTEEISNKYIVKFNKNNCNMILTHNLEIHEKVKSLLKTNNIKHYTYTPKHLKSKNVVLKNIYGEYSETEIISEINKLQIENIAINKVIKLNKVSDPNKPNTYLVVLKNDSDITKIKKIRILHSQSIKWQDYKKKTVYQCHKCQLTGHSSYNCNLEYRCVRCTAKHEPGKCPEKEKDESNKSPPKCVNCGLEGHPASYRGCDYLKFAKSQELKRKQLNKEIKQAKINKIYNRVNPHTSYAQAYKNNNEFNRQFPPIYSQMPQTQTHSNNQAHNESLIELLNQMKQDIISSVRTEIQTVNTQVVNNSKKIEIIANKLGLKWE